MLLSELEWGEAQDPDDRVQASPVTVPHCTIYERLDGLYDVWIEPPGKEPVTQWNDLTAIEAQAILFHLTNEVTTHPTKENENEA